MNITAVIIAAVVVGAIVIIRIVIRGFDGYARAVGVGSTVLVFKLGLHAPFIERGRDVFERQTLGAETVNAESGEIIRAVGGVICNGRVLADETPGYLRCVVRAGDELRAAAGLDCLTRGVLCDVRRVAGRGSLGRCRAAGDGEVDYKGIGAVLSDDIVAAGIVAGSGGRSGHVDAVIVP